MEKPKGRLREKMDVAVDCLCRLSLGACKLCHVTCNLLQVLCLADMYLILHILANVKAHRGRSCAGVASLASLHRYYLALHECLS